MRTCLNAAREKNERPVGARSTPVVGFRPTLAAYQMPNLQNFLCWDESSFSDM